MLAHFVLISLLNCLNTFAVATLGSQVPLETSEWKYLPRPATEDDLDDIVDTFIAAFKPGEMWQYVYTDDDKYANYTWTCTRKLLQEQWDDLGAGNFINVIAVPRDDQQNGQRTERVVSLAAWVWQEEGSVEARTFSTGLHALHDKCSDNLDVNVTRVADLEQQFDRIAEPFLRNQTESQLYLALLATHPDWDGHGFAATQLDIGLAEAALAEKPITLIATPAGFPLYDSYNFASLQNFTLIKLDHLGILWSEYMRWEAEEDAHMRD